MSPGLIARKVGMSRAFLANGEVAAVTYLQVEPNTVVRTKTTEKDGYNAVVLGIEPRTWKTKKGAERTRFRTQKEWAVPSLDGFEVGKTITAEAFPVDSLVSVSGTSKGKGFQGVVRRHGFHGGPATHGSHFKREPGSIGMRAQPGRVLKGHPMAGHMGRVTVTLRRRPVIVADAAKGIIGIRGAVPGPNGSTLYITLEPPKA
jgi:large subunit ribosomal protein L3